MTPGAKSTPLWKSVSKCLLEIFQGRVFRIIRTRATGPHEMSDSSSQSRKLRVTGRRQSDKLEDYIAMQWSLRVLHTNKFPTVWPKLQVPCISSPFLRANERRSTDNLDCRYVKTCHPSYPITPNLCSSSHLNLINDVFIRPISETQKSCRRMFWVSIFSGLKNISKGA